jgi:hypothetical protein
MLRSIVIAGLLVGVAAPAFAAEFFIVRGPDKKCQIVEKRPTDTKMVIVGDKIYVSRDEAQKQLTVVCKD